MSTTAIPTPAQRAWSQLAYGMFLHFGVNTFAGTGWGDGRFPAASFTPESLDCRQWASVMQDAQMHYAVLTGKHHDGFCLWPSKLTQYSIANSPARRDVVGEFVDACRSAGIKPGLYYSLWDRNCPFYDDDTAYAQYMQEQITELLKTYGPLVELWFDGGWDKDYPTRTWDYDPATDGPSDPSASNGRRWKWRELYDLIHRLQPDCLVINNSSSHRPGEVRVWPVDIRTSEHFDFIHRDKVCQPPETSTFNVPSVGHVHLPIEFCTSLNPDWFYTGKSYPHPGARTIAAWFKRARIFDGNLLLNVGPDRRGLIPDYHRDYLRTARQLMGRA